MINARSLYRAFLILASCIPALNLSAQQRILRSWELGPLTWKDFQVRHVSDSSLYFSDLYAELYGVYEQVLDGNLKYERYTVKNYMYPLSSWYDPDKCTDWTLRYEQTRFDIMEVNRRLIHNQHYDNKQFNSTLFHYSFPVNEVIRSFDSISRYGADTLVVQEYERIYREKLDSIEVRPVSDTIIRTKKWGMAGSLGPDMECFLNNVPDDLSFTYGIRLGFQINCNRWFMDFNSIFHNAGHLESDNFYYDPKNEYSWKKGRKVKTFETDINLGYKVIDNNRWTLMPIIGIGGNSFEQDTDEYIGKSYGYKQSSIDGTRVIAGMMLDWKLRRIINNTEYIESKIRFRITGARTNFAFIGPSYSINLGLQYVFDIRNLQKPEEQKGTNRTVPNVLT